MGGQSASAQLPQLIQPMLPTAGPLPVGPGWAFEFAWGGVRTLAEVAPGRVRLLGGDRGLTAGYPELDVLPDVARGRRMVLDGTIVALDAYGRPSSSRLQRRLSVQRPSATVQRRLPVAYYVFDLLRLDDQPTHHLPYQRRRELLEQLELSTEGTVALPPSFTDTDGQTVLDTAAKYGLPGVIAKRARSRYQPGRRSRSWVETALRRTQDVVIGGWLPGARGRTGSVGSVLVGLPTERGLHYVGVVGTGFTDAARHELTELLAGLARSSSPFAGSGAPTPDGVRWVAPELLAEVSYRQWTPDGRLANPVWRRLLPGKHPAAVQTPVLLAGPAAEPADEELAELDEAVRRARAEVEALRAQISPHFLYNVLNTITSYVRTDAPLARELLIDFADFTRYSFRSGVELSTLAEELDNVGRYVKLEQARFGERLRVEVRVPPELHSVPVPFLALQLAVEHAVQHGIEAKPGGGTVTIAAVDSGRDCLVTVTDDGDRGAANPWLTLRALDDRLRSAYGERGALLMDAPPEGGTRLSFRVPKPTAR
jgi:DNA ligase D-like protein (predicted ligase)